MLQAQRSLALPTLEPEFTKPYFEKLDIFVRAEYGLHPCYPPFDQII